MTKTILIILFLIITIAGLFIYFSYKLPPGVEAKGNETMVALVSLCTAIVSFFSTILTVILKAMEIRARRHEQ